MTATDRIVQHVRSRCAALLPPVADVAVGLSGGLDSIVLLHVFHALAPSLGFRLRAIHVHHGLNARADDWASFCIDVCARIGTPLTVERVNVLERTVHGLEAAARAARYRCYLTSGADFVALAHHGDDQAETVLLQLMRGAGPAGLAAMPEVRATAEGPRILRLLLGMHRADLLAYAEASGLRWVEDDSNADTGHARNFLRHEILPRLEVRFPGWRGTFARVAANAADAMTLADVLGMDDLAKLLTPTGLDLAALSALDPVRAANVLRVWLRDARVAAPPRDRLFDWLRQFATAGRHRRVMVPGASVALVAHQGRLRLDALPSAPPGWTVPWSGEARVTLPDGRVVRFEMRDGEGLHVDATTERVVHIATRRGGERLQLAGNRPHRPLKDLLRESGLPPWERDRVPIVYVDGRVAWACGVGGDAAFTVGPGVSGLVPVVSGPDTPT